METPAPTVGRIVHYTPPEGGQPLAAIVTRVYRDVPTVIDVTVFPPGGNVISVITIGPARAAGEPGWSWPPRA